MFKDEVFEYLTKIPKAKVVTYSQIARALNRPKACRAVGNILHSNTEPVRYPCFKVVNNEGRLSDAYGFGGFIEQRRRLLEDGVELVGNHVDLKKYQWQDGNETK
ncbi:MAG: MGMT family protein [Erysipelotrichaceae bacterium]|nr:MGMT family protein [Erysipelotrichaceae bacterium]